MGQSKWKVTSNSICGATMYAVYRQIDVNGVNHSGNREYATEYMDSREDAASIADEMNKEEEQ